MRFQVSRRSIALLVVSTLAVSIVAYGGGLRAILGAAGPQTGIPDFTIFAFPHSLVVFQGSTAASTIIVSSVNGFQGSVTLVASSLCSSGSCPMLTLNPASVLTPPNGNASSTLTISTTATTVIANYTATIFGSNGSLSHSVNVNFKVVAPAKPDLSITANPISQTFPPGFNATSTLILTSINGFSGSVGLSIPLVPCTTYCWSVRPASVNLPPGGTNSSTLIFFSTTATTPGNYNVPVLASGGGLSHQVTVTFTVASSATPDFSMTANPMSQTVRIGVSATSTIILMSINGFGGSVGLTLPLTCLAIGCPVWSINPASINLTPGGTATSTLTATFYQPGNYSVLVTGRSGNLTHTINVFFVVSSLTTPDFSMTANPVSLPIPAGSTGVSMIFVRSLNGFAGVVSLSTSPSPLCPQPGCSTWSITPPSVTLRPNGTATAALNILAGTSFPGPGQSATVTVYGNSGSLSHSVSVVFMVVSSRPDFTISANPLRQAVPQGSTAFSKILLTSVNNFSGTVSLSTSPPPLCVSCPSWGVNPSSIMLGPGGTGAATLTFSTTLGTPTTNFFVTVRGTSGSLSHNVTVTFTVVPSSSTPNFAMSANPSSLTIPAGTTGTSTITFASLGGFSGNVTLSTSPLPVCPAPACTTWSVNPTLVKLVPNGTARATLSIFGGTGGGNGTVIIFGNSGSLSHSASVSFIVTTSNVDFSLKANPSVLGIARSSCQTSTITVTSVIGFNGTISLAAASSTPNISTSLTPSAVSVPPGGSATSTLTICASASTPTGSYAVTVTGRSNTLSHLVNIPVTVTSPDFTISARPTNVTIASGSSGTAAVNVTSINNFSGTVNLSTRISASSLTATLNPLIITLNAGGTSDSTLTVSTTTATLAGFYIVTVTGTSSSINMTHSFQVGVTVTGPAKQDFTISASPIQVTVPAGSTGFSTITVTAISGFSGTVFFSLSSSPGTLTNISPHNLTGSGTATLAVSSGTAGNYTTVVTGASGSLSHSVTVQVIVTSAAKPDFSMSASPNSLSITPGSSAASTIMLASLNSFNGTVNLADTVSSSPISVSLSRSSIPLPPGGAGSAVLTVSALSSTPPGTYTVNVTGTASALSYSVTVLVTVAAPPPPPDFTITSNPSSQSIARGSSTSFTITVKGTNGFNGTVSLSATIFPVASHGPTTTLPSTVGPYSNSTLTVSTSRHTPTGTYTITITATSGSLAHTVTVTVIVTK